MPAAPGLNERTAAERVNGSIKDDYGGRHLRVRGPVKVFCHLMFGIVAFTASCLFNLFKPQPHPSPARSSDTIKLTQRYVFCKRLNTSRSALRKSTPRQAGGHATVAAVQVKAICAPPAQERTTKPEAMRSPVTTKRSCAIDASSPAKSHAPECAASRRRESVAVDGSAHRRPLPAGRS